MADFSKPTLTSRYDTQFIAEMKAREDAIATMKFTSDTNQPVGTLRYDRTNRRVEEWDGAQWNIVGQLLQAASMMIWPDTTAPNGWLLCDGSAVSRTTYADLFAKIGTRYGAGNGSTTFNVPDMRLCFPLGVGTVGGETVTLGTRDANGVSHKHQSVGHYHGLGAGADLAVDVGHDHAAFDSAAESSHTHSIAHTHPSATTGAGSAHSHGVHNKYQGGGAPPPGVTDLHSHTNMPGYGSEAPNPAGGDSYMNTAGENAHTHAVTVSLPSGSSGPGGSHVHSVDVPSTGTLSRTPTGSIGNKTSGNDGNAALDTTSTHPPYLGVNFIIKT